MDLAKDIEDRLNALGVRVRDVEERFVRGSGAGGQKINKTSSTVCLRHGPTGVEVRVQRERSQAINRAIAWEELCAKLEARLRAAEKARQAAVAKVRRSNRPRSERQKAKSVAQKRARRVVKDGRKSIPGGVAGNIE